jgi:aryl-alcohol dehydrogenase-like predicted oxidoreductase
MRKRTSEPPSANPILLVQEPANRRGTASGTSRYSDRFADRLSPDFFRTGPDGLAVSSLGIGTYLGECDRAEDERYASTVTAAIGAGVNLLDTAINYRCQRSERSVGAAIEAAISGRMASRDELVVCSKGGYIPLADTPPATRDDYRSYLKREFFDTDILSPDDVVSGGHSIAPKFLRYSIARSRQNLGMRTIDIYYLHNPEQQAAAVTPQSLRERLRAAFMVLEDAVSRGEIGVYGCATWHAFRVPPGSKGHLSLEDLVAIARDVAGERHHFRVVQMPINLAMPEAFRLPTQPLGRTSVLASPLEAAAALGLSVVASASLMQAKLAHELPETVRALFPTLKTDAQRALAFVRALPAVTSALVGMRSEEHLIENLEIANA